MSRTKNQELSSWKDVLAKLRRIETTWRGFPLSKRDHATLTEAILLAALVLSDLSNRCEGFGTKREIVNWAMRIAHIDVQPLSSFLSEAISLWRRLSEPAFREQVGGYDGFKHRLRQEYPFAGSFLSPIRGAIKLFFDDPNPSTFAPPYQALSFLMHLSLCDLNMAADLEQEYLEQEEYLARLHLPPQLVDQMSAVMEEWFRDFRLDVNNFQPKHGPGGVAELKGDVSLYSKYRRLSPNALIKYVFLKHGGIDAASYCPLDDVSPTSLESRVIFVPKSMKTLRTISAEPATLQYFQQGVDHAIREYIRSHRYLKHRIDLNDQSVQQEAALDASRNRSFATVDLSAASDSISYDLVKRVFRHTRLYPFLVALRSRTAVLPSKRVVALAKFAPMGSALTFPIESLIFACVVECAARYVHSVTGALGFRYRVYGDDIVVPECCLADLVTNLQSLGFKVNESKSYAGEARFRESCGCDAYDGVDVTPMRIGRSFSALGVSSFTPDVFMGLKDMANSAMSFSLPLLRRYLVDRLVSETRPGPLFSGDPDVGVYSPMPTNFHLPKRRWNAYQRMEVLASVVRTCEGPPGYRLTSGFRERAAALRTAEETLDGWDDIRYFEWLRSVEFNTRRHSSPDTIILGCTEGVFHLLYSPVNHQVTHIGSMVTYLGKQWVGEPTPR